MTEALLRHAMTGRTSELRALLEEGADPTEPGGTLGWDATRLAAMNGHSATLAAIVELHPAATASTGPDGWSPLHAAAAGNHYECVRFLLEKGADGTAVNKRGLTAAVLAERAGHSRVASLIKGEDEPVAEDAMELSEAALETIGDGRVFGAGGSVPPPPPSERSFASSVTWRTTSVAETATTQYNDPAIADPAAYVLELSSTSQALGTLCTSVLKWHDETAVMGLEKVYRSAMPSSGHQGDLDAIKCEIDVNAQLVSDVQQQIRDVIDGKTPPPSHAKDGGAAGEDEDDDDDDDPQAALIERLVVERDTLVAPIAHRLETLTEEVTRVKEANRLRGKVVVKRQPELQALRAAAKERCIGEPMATGRTLGATQLVAAIATSVERLRVLAPLLSRSHAREVSENIREELGDSASKFRRDATELSRLVVGGSGSRSGGSDGDEESTGEEDAAVLAQLPVMAGRVARHSARLQMRVGRALATSAQRMYDDLSPVVREADARLGTALALISTFLKNHWVGCTNARRDVSSIDLVVANLSTVITATKPGSPAKAAARELLLEQEDSTERVYALEDQIDSLEKRRRRGHATTALEQSPSELRSTLRSERREQRLRLAALDNRLVHLPEFRLRLLRVLHSSTQELLHGFEQRSLDEYDSVEPLCKEDATGRCKRAVLDGETVVLKAFSMGDAVQIRRELDVFRKARHESVMCLRAVTRVETRATDTLFLEMPYAAGGNLKEWKAARELGATDEAGRVRFDLDLWTLLKQVLAGLAHLHSVGIVHRDIKPSNILLLHKGLPLRAVISDFNIAKEAAADATATATATTPVGTLGYIAPEVRGGAPATERSDVFSFGVLTYECFLHAPRPAAEALAPSDVPEGANPRLRDLLDSLLAHDPAHRPTATDALFSSYFTSMPAAPQNGGAAGGGEVDFPEQWDAMPDPLGPQSREWWRAARLVDVQTNTPEFQATEARMRRSLPDCFVHRLQRVQSRLLWLQFAHGKRLLALNDGAVAEEETTLFHGSGALDPEQVLRHKEGLDPRFAREGFYGRGIYFAKDISYVTAGRYAHRLPNGQLQVLLCKVALGRTQEMGMVIRREMTMPDVIGAAGGGGGGERAGDEDGDEAAPVVDERFNSTRGGPHGPWGGAVDASDGGSTSVICAVYKSEQVYPAYLITYSP